MTDSNTKPLNEVVIKTALDDLNNAYLRLKTDILIYESGLTIIFLWQKRLGI